MVDPFAPTAIGTGSCRWTSCTNPYTGVSGYAQMNFTLSGDLTPGTSLAFFYPEFYSTFFYPIFNCQPCDSAGGPFTVNLNLASGFRRFSGNVGVGGFTYDECLPLQVCVVWSLFTAAGGRRGRGIYRTPGIPLDWVTAGTWNSAFDFFSAPLAVRWLTPFTVYGITFTPCVWSRAGGTFDPITRVSITPHLSRLHKRRPWRQNKNPFIVLPDVWP